MSTVQVQAPRFKVGDWVSFEYGTRHIWAQVIEDRGPLGVGGRRLYWIRFDDENESGESIAFELPETNLSLAVPDRAAVIDYLKRGGLLAILQANLGGGRVQPRAWLSFDSHGNLIHTFVPERGIVGGDVIPFFALHEYHVFAPKAGEVIALLAGFGLARDEAEDVVRAVGTVP